MPDASCCDPVTRRRTGCLKSSPLTHFKWRTIPILCLHYCQVCCQNQFLTKKHCSTRLSNAKEMFKMLQQLFRQVTPREENERLIWMTGCEHLGPRPQQNQVRNAFNTVQSRNILRHLLDRVQAPSQHHPQYARLPQPRRNRNRQML